MPSLGSATGSVATEKLTGSPDSAADPVIGDDKEDWAFTPLDDVFDDVSFPTTGTASLIGVVTVADDDAIQIGATGFIAAEGSTDGSAAPSCETESSADD